MKLKDYINEGYTIITSPRLAKLIREKYQNAVVFTGGRRLDGLPSDKVLIDNWYSDSQNILNLKNHRKTCTFELFTTDFLGDLSVEPPLLEIKLKDSKSVPEVYYHGEQVGLLPKEGLVDIYLHWHTATEDPSELLAMVEYLQRNQENVMKVNVSIDSASEETFSEPIFCFANNEKFDDAETDHENT